MARLSELQEGGVKYFEVSYMEWQEFKELITNGDDTTLAPLREYHCIIGGVDYTTDFR